MPKEAMEMAKPEGPDELLDRNRNEFHVIDLLNVKISSLPLKTLLMLDFITIGDANTDAGYICR